MFNKEGNFWDNLSRGSMFIVLSQIWETSSYFGLRSILVLFLTSAFVGYSDEKAFSIYLAMVALADVLSVASGRYGDSKMGSLRVAFMGSLLLVGGFYLISKPFTEMTFYFGAACLSVGVALYRPNCFAILGKLAKERAKELAGSDERSIKARVDSAMTLVYSILGVGFVMAYLIISSAMEYKGWYFATNILSLSMVLSAIFMLWYAIVDNNGIRNFVNFLFCTRTLLLICISLPLVALCGYCIMHYSVAVFVISFCVIASLSYLVWIVYNEDTKKRKIIATFIVYLCLFFVYIALERQAQTFFALFFKRNVDREILGHVIPAASIYVIAPLATLCLGPLSAYFVHRWSSTSILPGLRAVLAAFCLFCCHIVMAMGCCMSNGNGIVGLVWPVMSMVLFAVGDSMFVPSMLSMASRLAPKNTSGVFMGMVFVWIALGTMAAKPLATMVAIPNNQNINPIASLVIYQKGFISLAIGALCLTMIAVVAKIALDRVVRVEDYVIGDGD